MKRIRYWLIGALVILMAAFAVSCKGGNDDSRGTSGHQHDFANGSCRACGEADPGVHFDFRLNTNTDDKTYELRGGGLRLRCTRCTEDLSGVPGGQHRGEGFL